MADLSTHSITLIDRHVHTSELRATFFPNEVAISCHAAGSLIGVSLERADAEKLHAELGRWLKK